MATAAYGSWSSPIAPELLARGQVRLAFPSFAEDGSLYFTELRPSEAGRIVVVRRRPDGAFEDLLPAPYSARSRVHEYGGLSYLVHGGELLFVHQADQQLWRRRLDASEEPRPLTSAPGTRFAEPVIDASRKRLIAVAERHTPGREPENFLAAVSLADGRVEVLVSGRDFYAAPALAPDGTRLAFLAWDHPHMPWDAAEVCVARLSAEGAVLGIESVAGGPGGSAFQPSWSPDGLLYFALEAEQFWNLHRMRDGRVECVAKQAAELGQPLWQLGTRMFEFIDANTVVGICFEQGLSRLIRIDIARGAVQTLSDRFPYVGQLALRGDALALALGWVGSGSELVRFDWVSGRSESLRTAYAGPRDPLDTSEPEAIHYPTSRGDTAHAFFYPPKNHAFTGPEGTLPPLIVIAHGGPTAGTSPIFSPSVQFWTTRGFALLDVNYRGSSGYGRAYRERLRGEWGVLDVDDCVAGARCLAERGRVDRQKLVIRGGSAGGYTVLRALAEHDLFAAGSCHYGISDLEALTRDTHKFESRYDRFLIGPYPEGRELFVARSPIHCPERIRRPIAFFQGLEDKVVPADQTENMARTLRARGIDTEYHAYAGEQHGFRKAETICDVLRSELAFFTRVLGL